MISGWTIFGLFISGLGLGLWIGLNLETSSALVMVAVALMVIGGLANFFGYQQNKAHHENLMQALQRKREAR